MIYAIVDNNDIVVDYIIDNDITNVEEKVNGLRFIDVNVERTKVSPAFIGGKWDGTRFYEPGVKI